MSFKLFRWLIVLASIAISGIIVTQVYWVNKAFSLEEIQFRQSIHIALQNVAHKFATLNQMPIPDNPIQQVSSDYYLVNINGAIDSNVLEHYLKSEFSKVHLNVDFEYGIYDCSTDEMVYGNYIQKNQTPAPNYQPVEMLKSKEFIYYFGIRFPNRNSYLASQMRIWWFSSFILVIVIAFFAYAVFMIFRQKRLSEVQRDFINNMTHEFKTPISTIAVSTDLLKKQEIINQPQTASNYVQIIEKENTRLKTQIEKVLQMAKMDGQKLALQKEEVNLHHFLQEIVENFKIAHAEVTIDFQFQATQVIVLADIQHLTNIIQTLLDNAVKYVESSPKIILKTSNQGQKIILEIQDNGIGIPKKFQKRIFKKFFRVPTGDIHNVKGFGLGLSYVKLVTKVHHWKIQLKSEEKKGANFIISIPVIKNSLSQKSTQKRKVQKTSNLNMEKV